MDSTGTLDAYGRRAVSTPASRFAQAAKRGGTDRVPDQQVEDRHASIELMEALSRLPVRDRAVVALRYLEDLSVRDVAAALDLPEGTVKSRSSRALTRLEQLPSLTHAIGWTSS